MFAVLVDGAEVVVLAVEIGAVAGFVVGLVPGFPANFVPSSVVS